MAEAVGIATPAPQFTWTLDGRGAAAASEIRVTDGKTEVWRGRGASLFDGVYAGPALEPGLVYDWQVRLVDATGTAVTGWTKPQKLVRGLPDEQAWGEAKWIGEDRDFTPRLGDGRFVVEFKPLKGRFVVCVRCAPDATGGVTFAAGAAEGAKTNDWNKLEIVCRGTIAEAKLNGKAFARREGTPKDGTFAVWAEKGAEARMKSAAWHDAKGVRVLYDNYAGSMHLQQVFFRMDRDGRVLIVKDQPYVHPGILPKNCPRFRKTFACGKEVVSAVASVTARGFHELWLNGAAADPRRTLAGAPMTKGGWLFETYDVTSLVRRGDNTVGLWLSPGYSDDYVNYGPRWLKPKQALLRLDIRYADGTREAVVTDGSWEFTEESPVVKTSIYHGETIDRALDDPDWCRPAGSRAVWRPVRVLGATIADGTDGVCLVPNDMPPIRRFDPRRPVHITEPMPGVFVADFGQNRAGVVEVRAKGPRGTRIRLRTSEILGKDGMIDPWTNSLAESTDEFVLAGTGAVETFLPRFTYHGFHYVEITGWPGKPTADDLTDWAVGADVEETSTFSCSDKGLMWLHNAAYWSMRSNLMTFPSDCCMRNERVGCNMDSQAFEDAALQFFDLRRFYRGWLGMSGAGGPNPAWGGDATTLARRLWRYYGDRRILEERYPLMKTACQRVLSQSPTGIWKKGFGDWCAPNEGTWASYFNDVGITETSVFAEMLDSTAEAASALGLAGEAETYRATWRKTAEAFEREFRNAGTATYGDGSQSTFVLPLAFGLVPERDRADVTAKLVETIRLKDRTRFDTGIFGTRYIGDVLLDAGEADLFLDLFTQKEFPGFGYMAAQGGTTLWEQWPFKCSMDSHNHAMMSGAASCLYTHLAGIRPAKPGYGEILVKPAFPSRLGSLTATRQTPRGVVRVSWTRRDGQVDLTVSVPPFTPARLVLPDGSERTIDREVSVRLPKDLTRQTVVCERTADGVRCVRDGKVVWCFSTAKGKPCVHPLHLPDGTPLTASEDADHPWHRGLWFCWKFLNGVNYWETDANGLSKGEQRVVSMETECHGASASVRLMLAWGPRAEPFAPVLDETRTIVFSEPRKDGSYDIEWRAHFTARERVEIERTPPYRRKDGTWGGGYAGFSLRLEPTFAAAAKTTSSCGATGQVDVVAREGRWIDYSVDAHGGIRLEALKAPEPTTFYHWANRRFTNLSPIFGKPLTLERGETLELASRAVVHGNLLKGEGK